MEFQVAIFCLILALARTDDRRYYKTSLASPSVIGDQEGEKTESHGFVEPLDFASFTQQFFHGGAQNFASLPFTTGGGFDFFGAESKDSKQLRVPASFGFPNSPFGQNRENNSGFVTPVNFASAFDGKASTSGSIYRPQFQSPPVKSTLSSADPTVAESEEEEEYIPSTTAPKYSKQYKGGKNRGKSSYPAPGHRSELHPTAAVYADSADVEVFYPPGKAILPQINGRPKPYDGYRSASEVEGRVHARRSANQRRSRYPHHLNDRRAQQFSYGEHPAETKYHEQKIHQEHRRLPENDESEEQSEEEEEEEEEAAPKKKNSGLKYQYDSTIKVPDLVIKRYPYEKEADNDEEFTHDYEHYKKSLPGDLEKHYGTPDFYTEKYTVAATENLEKDKNCERVERNKRDEDGVAQTCYICRNPKTGGSYEQCAYENEPKSKKYYYGGSTSSASQQESKPVVYRHKRSLDFFKPSNYEYFVYNEEPNLNRKARAETFFSQPTIPPKKAPKRKNKKFSGSSKKKLQKRKPRQHGSSNEGPPSSYNGPKYTYEGPSQAYEGPSSPYEGPSSPYEGPSFGYEGPDHDDYYDRTDDRIPYASNQPLLSSFVDDTENKNRPRRGPKADAEEFSSEGYLSDFRFGPEFFSDEYEEKPEPNKRNTHQREKEESSEPTEQFFSGNVKIFKNGDVCTKMKKENMLCMVCDNDKTGAKYEQCQYSTKPNNQGYTYGSQKSFSSNKGENDRPQRHIKADQIPDLSDKIEKKFMITKMETKTFNEGRGYDEPLVTSESRIKTVRQQRETEDEEQSEDIEEAEDDDEGDGKRTETSERIEARDGIEDLDEFLGEQKGSNEANYPGDHESYDDYFKRVFPEFERYEKLTPKNFDPFSDLEDFRENGPEDKSENISYEESESKPGRLLERPSSIPPKFFETDEDSKKDLAKALAHFQNRDWSKCKKRKKDKLICYECLDSQGIKNEECMFVEGSEPVASHLAYHEKKDYDPAASSIEAQARFNISTEPPALISEPSNEEQRVEEIKEKEQVKGDFEGAKLKKEKVNTTTEKAAEEPIKKKKKRPVKKYHEEDQNPEATWESSRTPVVDESVVKIFLNNTDTTLA